MPKLVLLLLILLNITKCNAQFFSFEKLLNSKPILKQVTQNAKKYRLQIIYTQISRDENGKPLFKNYTYLLDSSNYFYCASLVKLPTAILALEKLNELNIDKNTIMFTDSANACQHRVKTDTTAINNLPSIAQYIKRMFLVSDNFAYSRVYEFLGVDYLHNRLFNLGYKNIRIVNRFDGACKNDEHVTTNPISFYSNNLQLIYTQKQQSSHLNLSHPLGIVNVGNAYINSNNKKINTPKNFSAMNFISLQNIHTILQRLVFNNYYSKQNQYHLTKNDTEFLLKYLTLLPSQSTHPTYNKNEFYDSYKKYFIYGDSKKPITDTSITIANIVGQSYGFMVDCAYIQNKTKGIEFLLSAVIYTNNNNIINDGKYEYSTIALPFLAELGRQVYNFELQKK